MTFNGFPDEAFAFFEGLEADNSKTYWTKNKATYEAAVRDPMLALLDELREEFGEGHVFRPYRDVRFSKDKSPYKDHQGAFVQLADGMGNYVQVSADGLLVAGGFHDHASDQVERYRAAVADDFTGRQLADITDAVVAAGFDLGGDRLKTRPRGIAEDHPRLELLRHRSLTAERSYPPEPWVSTPKALDAVREGWRALGPLNQWLFRHVGPTRQPRR